VSAWVFALLWVIFCDFTPQLGVLSKFHFVAYYEVLWASVKLTDRWYRQILRDTDITIPHAGRLIKIPLQFAVSTTYGTAMKLAQPDLYKRQHYRLQLPFRFHWELYIAVNHSSVYFVGLQSIRDIVAACSIRNNTLTMMESNRIAFNATTSKRSTSLRGETLDAISRQLGSAWSPTGENYVRLRSVTMQSLDEQLTTL